METKGLINFCHSKLQSNISCNTCCSENYEATNLLSSDRAKLQRGFMADRFIKPPIELHVTFKYPVNISHILIWPRVGQQKSVGFELHSIFTEPASQKTSSPSSSQSIERIVYCSLTENDEGVLLYCPHKFGKYIKNFCMNGCVTFVRRPFSWNKLSAIIHCSSIRIKITRTNASSVPSIGKIEIWGRPGHYVPLQGKKEMWQLWTQRMQESGSMSKAVSLKGEPQAKPGTSANGIPTNSPEIPEEFLDALTFEVMSLPMVLPCGKVVDQRTLERHQNSEANWGRLPSDPFTGRTFTPTVHPVLDNVLKSRIDRFLIVYQDREELRFVPRTVGRKSHVQGTINIDKNPSSASVEPEELAATSDSLITPSDSSKKHSMSHATVGSSVSEDNFGHTRRTIVDRKKEESSHSVKKNGFNICDRATVRSSVKRSRSPDVIMLPDCSKSLKVCDSQVSASNSRPCLDNNSKIHGLGSRYEDNLDAALKAVLTGLPSFTRVDQTAVTAAKRSDICRCENKDNLYKLPCTHLFCRRCLVRLLENANPTCAECKTKFISSQPVKYHP